MSWVRERGGEQVSGVRVDPPLQRGVHGPEGGVGSGGGLEMVAHEHLQR